MMQFTVWGATASADTLANTFGADDSYTQDEAFTIHNLSTDDLRLAAQFTLFGGDHTLDMLKLAVAKRFDSGTLQVTINADSANKPGQVLESFTLTDLLLHTDRSTVFPAATTISSVTHPLLHDGSNYWVVLSAPVVSNYSDVHWYLSNASYGDSQWVLSAQGSGYSPGWNTNTGTVVPAFMVTGSPVPEPATLSLLTFVGLALIRRRK